MNGNDGKYNEARYSEVSTQSIISLLQVSLVLAIVISKLDVGQVTAIEYKGQINLIVHAQFCAPFVSFFFFFFAFGRRR